jgi:hypothetical protein
VEGHERHHIPLGGVAPTHRRKHSTRRRR